MLDHLLSALTGLAAHVCRDVILHDVLAARVRHLILITVTLLALSLNNIGYLPELSLEVERSLRDQVYHSTQLVFQADGQLEEGSVVV